MFVFFLYRMRDSANDINFTCRVLHSPLHTFSAVQIFQGEPEEEAPLKPIVTCRLVDSQQLPLPNMVGYHK